MKVRIYTLIDITETGERRGPDKLAIGQQSNYDSVISVLGLRSNPEPEYVKQHNGALTELGFGSKFKGKHNYWEMLFTIPDSSNDIETMQSDFDLVPVILELSETAKINISVFKTTDSTERNIVFNYVDNN